MSDQALKRSQLTVWTKNSMNLSSAAKANCEHKMFRMWTLEMGNLIFSAIDWMDLPVYIILIDKSFPLKISQQLNNLYYFGTHE